MLLGLALRVEDGDANTTTFYALLVWHVFVQGHQEVEAGLFGGIQELSVLEFCPALPVGSGDLVAGKQVRQIDGDIVIEQDLHAISAGSSS